MAWPMGLLGAAAVIPATDSDYLLQETLVTSNTGSVVFSNLADYATAGYKNLQVRVVGRSTRADTDSILGIQFNGATSGYYAEWFIGTGSAPTAGVGNSQPSIWLYSALPGATITANVFGSAIIDIIEPFNTSKNTTVREIGGMSSSTFSRSFMASGLWTSTAAVTSITMVDAFGSLVPGSRVSLYGSK